MLECAACNMSTDHSCAESQKGERMGKKMRKGKKKDTLSSPCRHFKRFSSVEVYCITLPCIIVQNGR